MIVARGDVSVRDSDVDELEGEKNDCSALQKCVCQAGSESEVHMWSGITIALVHLETKETFQTKGWTVGVSMSARGICCCSKESFWMPDQRVFMVHS